MNAKSDTSSTPSETQTRRGYWAVRGYAVIGTLVGVLLLVWLWQQAGATLAGEQVAAALPVLLWVVPWFALPIIAAAWSWRLLFPRRQQPAIGVATLLTWIGLGVNWLLPVAMIGGEVVKLRMGVRRGWRAHALIATLVGDKTLQVATQGLYTLVGLSLLVWLSGQAQGVVESLVGLGLFALAVYIFYRLQNSGLFSGLAARLARFSSREQVVKLRAARLDACVRGMYRRRARWWWAAAWRMVFRVLMAGEVWLVMYWLGEPVSVAQAVTLESLAQGARAAAFFIPAGIGAQEAGLVTVGLFLGVPAEAILIVALVKRLRELVVGGLALLVWQALEGYWLWLRQRRPGHSD